MNLGVNKRQQIMTTGVMVCDSCYVLSRLNGLQFERRCRQGTKTSKISSNNHFDLELVMMYVSLTNMYAVACNGFSFRV